MGCEGAVVTGDRRSGIADEAGSSIEEQIAVHQALAWSNLELRTVDGRPVAGLDARRRREVLSRLLDSGLDVPVIDSTIGNWAKSADAAASEDFDELKRLASVAERLGTRVIRIMSYPRGSLDDLAWRRVAIRRVTELCRVAEGHGLTLALENCVGWGADSADRMLDLIDAVDSPSLGVLFDTGNAVVEGVDGYRYLESVLRFVVAVHVKDARRQASRAVVFTGPGQGEARVLDCLALAFRGGYAGPVAIEPHLFHVIHLGESASAETLRSSYMSYARNFEPLLREALKQAAPTGV